LHKLEEALFEATGHRPFAPGLEADELELMLGPTGLVLPPEVRSYYRCRDGTQPTSRVRAPWLIGHWLPLCLADAIQERQVRKTMVVEAQASGSHQRPDDIWKSSWLPLFRTGNGYLLAVDCATRPDENGHTELLRISRISPEPRRVPSLAYLFEFFLLALSSGAWAWDPERRRWIVEPRRFEGHPFAHLL